jgi:hypothetical protein
MNAGRGAGKTYNLIQWAKEADNRYIVGLNTDTGDLMRAEGLEDRFVHYTDAKEFFSNRSYAEVAFDDFHKVLPQYLMEEYGVKSHTSTVILSTSLSDSDSDLLPTVGFKILKGEYADRLVKMYGGTA